MTASKQASDNKVMALLSYLGILVLIPLLTAKEVLCQDIVSTPRT